MYPLIIIDMDYTVVIGVDAKHLEQLSLVWPTWKKCKPSILEQPMIAFYEAATVDPAEVNHIVGRPDLKLVPWPPKGITYAGDNSDKWSNPQRHKMLAGFCYVPALYVKTKYFLKLDTDAVANGMDDWIDGSWFDCSPAIVGPPWGFTRPADQMLKLDDWIEQSHELCLQYGMRDALIRSLMDSEPLKIAPEPGADRVSHSRICSWCAFFDTAFNRSAALLSNITCGHYQLPIASQDGLLWYLAKRAGRNIVRAKMKNRGWEIWSCMSNIKRRSTEVMQEVA